MRLRELVGLSTEVEFVVLDVRRITDVTDFARQGLQSIDKAYAAQGRMIVVVDDSGRVSAGSPDQPGPQQVFELRRQAIEWVEERLLERHCAAPSHAPQVDVVDARVLSGLDDESSASLLAVMKHQHFPSGTVVLRQNEAFDGIFVITRGVVETSVADAEGEQQRLTVLGPGMSFGEFGLIGDGRHGATVTAMDDLEVAVLSPQALSDLERDDPALALLLWRAISQDAFTRLREQLAEIRDHDRGSP